MIDQGLKTIITAELVRDKKDASLEKKLAAMVKGPGLTLEKIASANAGMQIVIADSIRWSDGYIPGYGVDRALVEAMSGLAPGKLSRPVKTTDGYAVVLVTKKTLPAGLDVKAEKITVAPQLFQAKQQQMIGEYLHSLRKVVDSRP